ncbi:MAG: 3-hydroxybutyryl-CoA dehydrogenase [Deltaproteobacteria bacterium]|nr:MAG: 3-hydroxybutyryl-CoA dehydrogenase [Deltaproteobacteria bacterium]
MEIKNVLVVGMGLMGSGIAQVYAQGGCEVFVNDISEDLIQKGIGSIDKFLSRAVSKGKLDEKQKGGILARIKPIKGMEEAKDIDLAQEAVPENMELKKKIHAQMDKVFPPRVIQAVCTSALCISEVAGATKRADKVIGTHFHSPAQVMKLVEVIRGLNTSDETVEAMNGILKQCGKLPINVNDSPGFVTSRIWCPFGMAAIQTLVERVATAEDIDTAIKAGFNHPMGPLELMDVIGLDVMLHAAEDLAKNYGPAYAPPPRLRSMVAAGQLGVKTGKGFYEYPRK